jgi:hypothetical protein
MATFGGYETVLEIYRHGLGSVARAKVVGAPEKAGEEPDFVVKAFQPPNRIASQEAIKPAVRSFLDRARTQQDVVTAGAKRWSPIYEAGAARDGAYYVTAYYSRSAVKLIAGRVKLSSQSLYVLVKSVLQGLIELKQYSGQPHGNLKPTNILIAGEGEIDEGSIFLADPAAREQLPAAGGEAADLAAVGELLYQLVLHRPFRGSQSWPVMASPEWSRLGRKSEAWRQFCNQLLNPTGADSLKLDEVARNLERLRDRTRMLTGRRARMVGLAVVLAVVTVGGWFYLQFRADWRELCLKYNEWFYRLNTELHSDAARLARLQGDTYIGNALSELDADGGALDPKKISGNELLLMSNLGDRPPLSLTAPRETRQALAKLRRFESQMSPEQWPLLHELSEREHAYETRHWTSAAAYLQHLIDGVSLQSHGDVAAQIDQLIAGQSGIRRDLAFIEDRLQVITATQKAIQAKAPADKVLTAFDPFATHYIESALVGAPPGDLEKVRAAVVPVADLAGKLDEVLQSEWGDKIDRERFAREGEIYRKPATKLDAGDFNVWLSEVQDFYRYKLDSESEPIAQLKKTSDDVRNEINLLSKEVPTEPPEKLKDFSQRLGAASASASKLADKAWVQKDRRTDVISRAGNEVQLSLKTLRDEVNAERLKNTIDQKKWWIDSGKAIADSSAINSAWNQWRSRLGVDAAALPLPPNEFEPIRTRAEQWTGELRAADKQFQEPPGQLGPLTNIAKAKREEKLGKALAAAAPSGQQSPDPAKLKAAAVQYATEYAAWCADLSSLLAEASSAKVLLDSGHVPGDPEAGTLGQFASKWPAREVWHDVSGQPPIDGVRSRLEALAEISRLSRIDLATRATASTANSIEWIRAAWQALGRLDSPRWPATPTELSQEVSIRQNLAKKIQTISDGFRKNALDDELKSQGPVRLASYLNTVRAAGGSTLQIEANLKAADAAMDAMSVSLANISRPTVLDRYRRLAALDDVDPGARFNLLLCGLRASAGNSGLTQPQLNVIADSFRQDVLRLPSDMRSQAAGLLERFTKVSEPDTLGGPLAQWRRTASGDHRVQYTGPALPGGAPQVLEFVEIDQPGKLPIYVCTTELSVGTFMSAIPVADWAQNGAAPLVEFQPGRDPRPGPRVWDWAARGDGSSSLPISISEFWLRARTTDDVFDYYLKDSQSPFNHQSLDTIAAGGNPLNRANLPMQYLPAPTALYVASLLGCRLPTVQEWKAAETINGSNLAMANLRDQTWQSQLTYATKNGGLPEWPDAGAFVPKATLSPPKTGRVAELAVKSSDHVLWFRDVDKDDGQVFHNLVGNVWEYVWEDSAAAERVADKSLHGWRSLLESPGLKLSVIGGSAISAPELAPTQPQALDLGHGTAPGSVDAWMGFADVGLRLAYTARPNSPAERLGWLLATQSYIGATDGPATRPAP